MKRIIPIRPTKTSKRKSTPPVRIPVDTKPQIHTSNQSFQMEARRILRQKQSPQQYVTLLLKQARAGNTAASNRLHDLQLGDTTDARLDVKAVTGTTNLRLLDRHELKLMRWLLTKASGLPVDPFPFDDDWFVYRAWKEFLAQRSGVLEQMNPDDSVQ